MISGPRPEQGLESQSVSGLSLAPTGTIQPSHWLEITTGTLTTSHFTVTVILSGLDNLQPARDKVVIHKNILMSLEAYLWWKWNTIFYEKTLFHTGQSARNYIK